MRTEPLLCWVLINTVPYHEARLRAAAERASLRLCMVQMTEVDSFRILQQPVQAERFHRRTLFPLTPWAEIDRRAMVQRLYACLSELKPDAVCVNGWSFGGCFAALGWCASHRVPAIMMSESTAIDRPRRWWREAIKRRVVALCSASLVSGSCHRDYIEELGATPDRVFTGYGAVDNEHFRTGADAALQAEMRLRASRSLPKRYFMACSRFSKKKNLFRLLQAYARFRSKAVSSAWALVIVGEGELKDQLLALRDRLGLQGQVHFPGPKDYQELPIYYGLAGAFVHASTSEQWGLVVNEAMAAGLPVLVSERCGCAADLLVPGVNGLLFDPYDVDDIAAAMIKIADGTCDREAMGRASREIVARWSPERFAESLSCAVETALGAGPPVADAIDHLLLWSLRQR
jgi:glycosyltransferase involved in cell wall biosynthesis